MSDSRLDLEHIETRFGVELEVCVKLDSNCIHSVTENLSAINYFNNVNTNTGLNFKKKFEYFLKSMIVSSPTFEFIKANYQYFAVESGMSIYLYDMNDLFKEDMTTLKSVEYKRSSKFKTATTTEASKPFTDKEFWKMMGEYKLPLFMEDTTIVCGDSLSNEKPQGFIDDSLSFSFECITPVLSITGQVTEEKLNQVLKPFLLFFGLSKPDCFIENYSMGFHVNISMFDTMANKIITIGLPPYFNKILKEYVKAERTLYKSVRSRRPLDETNNNYYSVWAKPIYKTINNKRTNLGTELTNNDIINKLINLNQNQSLLSQFFYSKQNAIRKKSNTLLEFRLFESRASIPDLIMFTFTAISFLHNALSPQEGGSRFTRKSTNTKRKTLKRKLKK